MGSQTTPKLPQNYPKQIELFVYSNNTNNTVLQKKLPQRPQKQFSKDFVFYRLVSYKESLPYFRHNWVAEMNSL